MKLSYLQLEKQINKILAPIYLISGDELLLVQETLDLIRSSAQKAGFSERVKLTADANPEWGEMLYTEAHSLSLFNERRIFELDLRNVKFNQASSHLLQAYANHPDPNTLLLIEIHKLDKKNEQSSWYKTIEKNGVATPIWPIPQEQMPAWIIKRAKKMNLSFTEGAALLLAKHAEGNLFAAAQEIEKLCLFNSPHILDEKILEKIISEDARFDVFHLVDGILTLNGKRALQITQNLFAEGIEPTLMLWAITRELRTLAEMTRQMATGTMLSTLFNQFHIWEKRQAGVRTFLKRYSYEDISEFLLAAAKIDRIIKGIETDHVQNAFERFVLSIAGNGIIN